MNLRNIIAVVLLSLVGTVVHAQKMVVDVDKATDFTKFKSFGFTKGQIAPRATTSQLLVSAIERELTSRGLVRNDAEPEISITVLAAAGMDLQGIGPTWNNEVYKSWGGYGNPAALMTVTTGNLLIDIFVTKTNHGIFRGVAREIFVPTPSFKPDSNTKEMEKVVNKTVGKMFKKYPVKANK